MKKENSASAIADILHHRDIEQRNKKKNNKLTK